MTPIDNHFDEMTALLFLEGQLPEERASEVQAHVGTCAECRELVRSLKNEDVWLRNALTEPDEMVPTRLVHAPERGGAHWGWISAIGLAGAGSYTLWSGFIEPWRAEAAQAGFTQGNLLTMLFFTGAFWKGWDAMRSLIEFLTVATLGLLFVWLLRRHWSRLTTVAVVMSGLALALAMSPAAGAAEAKHGDPNYTLAAGQEVHTDLIVAADRTEIDGDVDGDLIVWSRNLTVNGHVKGDILSFAQSLQVNGPVDGNIRVFAQSFTLESSVGHNLMAWCQDLELGPKATVGGTITAGGDDLDLNGTIAGDGLLLGNTIDIGGTMGHDVTVRAANLTVSSDAVVKGRFKFTGRNEPSVSPSAKLASPLEVKIEKRRYRPNYAAPQYYLHELLFWGARFVFGLVILLLAPGFFFDIEASLKRYGPAMGFGVLFLCMVPIAAILVCVTVVGLGVGIASMLLYAVAVYSGRVFVGAWLGEKLLGASQGAGPAIGRLALGLALIQAGTMLPFLGILISVLATIWGLGGIVLAFHKHLRTQWAPAV
ncbi:MAG TPA: zf-HC2 domain-containing protein [Verrucomicrobiae bacterium]|nr:zf-HC2 domain-containing protein [Verrucomicrobiae bacterium]